MIGAISALFFLGSAFTWIEYCEAIQKPRVSEAIFCAAFSWVGIVWVSAIAWMEDIGCD
jgi:hypothetical protein